MASIAIVPPTQINLFARSEKRSSRTHLSLNKDAPEPRPVQATKLGDVIAIPQVGGLHHRYERRAA